MLRLYSRLLSKNKGNGLGFTENNILNGGSRFTKTFRNKDARGILMTVYSYLASVVILFPAAGIQPKKL